MDNIATVALFQFLWGVSKHYTAAVPELGYATVCSCHVKYV